MVYNTNNPLGSKDPRDLYDNATNFDKYSVGPDPMYEDRFGVFKLSIEGQQQAFLSAQAGRQTAFDALLVASAFYFLADYGPGINITSRSQYVIRDGVAYRLAPAATLPYTTTGNWVLESTNFTPISSDDILRQQLGNDADPSVGASLVARSSVVVPAMADFQGVVGKGSQAYLLRSYHATHSVGGGVFTWDATQLKSNHNGGVIISPTVPWDGLMVSHSAYLGGAGETDPSGTGCFVRVFSGKVDATWFGGFSSTAINAAVKYAYTTSKKRSIYLPSGDWAITSPILVPTADMHFIGDGQFSTTLTAQSGLDYIFDIGDAIAYIDNISIQHITLNGAYVSGLLAHIRSRKCQKKFLINNVEFTGSLSPSTGLLATSCWGMAVTGCHFYFVGRAMDLTGANSAQLIGNYCWNNSRENLVMADSGNTVIMGNAFETYGVTMPANYWNVNFSTGVHSAVFQGNWLETGGAANSHIRIGATCTLNDISRNTIYGNALVGHLVNCAGPSNSIKYNRLSINNAGFAHIRLDAKAVRCDIGENTIMGSSGPVSDLTAGNYFYNKKMLYSAASSGFDVPSLADGAGTSTTITVPGAELGDFVTGVSFTSDTRGVSLEAAVTATGTVTVRFQNETGAAVDLGAGFIRVRVEKV